MQPFTVALVMIPMECTPLAERAVKAAPSVGEYCVWLLKDRVKRCYYVSGLQVCDYNFSSTGVMYAANCWRMV